MTVDKPEETWMAKSEEKLVLNYSFLTHEGEDQTQVLNSIINLSSEHRELVKHPTVKAFLLMKWKKIVPMWTLWVILKLIFLMNLVGFAYALQSPNAENNRSDKTCDTMKTPFWLLDYKSAFNYDTENKIITTAQITFSVLLLFFWLIEVVQVLTSFKAWSSECRNWLQAAILCGSTYFCFAMFSGSGHCGTARHVVATLLPMVYFEGLYEVGYHYKLAKYINLFSRVLKTFSKYFLVYSGLILCFTGGYAVMLHVPEDSNDFPQTFWGLLPKVFVMVTGEEDFMDIPFNKNSKVFKVWEVLYFLLFMMFTVVILLNLLNGLAVADAKDMLEASETDCLCSLLGTAAFWDMKFMKKQTKPVQCKDAEKKLEEGGGNEDKNMEDFEKMGTDDDQEKACSNLSGKLDDAQAVVV